MISEQNREIIQQLYEEVSSKRQQNIDPGFKSKGFTQYTVSSRPSSLKTFNNFFNAVATAFPDYQLNIENIVEKGDRIMARYTISGTQRGAFMGLSPTNGRLTITCIDIFRLDHGRVVEHWDAAHQISALPSCHEVPDIHQTSVSNIKEVISTPG
jgi:predicted ester cyclase